MNKPSKNLQKWEIHAKHLFLTYPVKEHIFNKTRSQLIEMLKEIFTDFKANLNYILVSEETGEKKHDSKDYQHIHVLCSFDRKVRIRNPHTLDLAGIHGHYKSINKKKGSVARVKRYCMKDGQYTEWKDTSSITKLDEASGNVLKLVEHLRSNKDEKGLLSNLSSAAEATYAYHKERIDKAVNVNVVRSGNVHQYSACNFNLPPEYLEWQKSRERKALLLLGKSCTGKTSLALASFKNPLLVRDLNTLKKLDNSHDGIVFDDVIFATLKREQKIHLLDVEHETGWNVKFGTVEIRSMLPRIFTSNEDVHGFLGYLETMDIPEELKRRYICCIVEKDLRKKK